MATPNANKAALSSAFYTSFFLKLYQRYVLGYNFPVLWGCDPESILVPHFSQGFTSRHLDCGVADGYFPHRTLEELDVVARSECHLTLIDLNVNSLAAARRRILGLIPNGNTSIRCINTNIATPLPNELIGSSFTSISMFNLFHCVPGGVAKWQAIITYTQVLADDGVLTGCTILGKDYIISRLAWWNMRFFNFLGLFCNWDDSREDVESVLNQEFAEVETKLVGMVLLFKARKPRRR
ncbi:methyltransferase [Xylaria flabelliformis]|nr:methyltransferase [Xylaria flabelliformis]